MRAKKKRETNAKKEKTDSTKVIWIHSGGGRMVPAGEPKVEAPPLAARAVRTESLRSIWNTDSPLSSLQ